MEQPPARSARLPLSVLALAGLGTAICYAGALARFPLLRIYDQPIQNLTKLTQARASIGIALAIAIVALFVGYGAGATVLAAHAGRAAPPRRTPRALPLLVLGFPLLFLALLLLVYPVTSIDIYDYLFRGRMLVRYGANTFIQTPSDFKSDPLFWYTAWRRAVTAYGPLWEGMSWLTARLAGEAPGPPGQNAALAAELLRLMLAYKLLAVLGYLFCGAAIDLVLRRTAPAYRWLGMYLWLWNPLALWESVVAGHNDAWMAGLIVLAVGLLAPREQAAEREAAPQRAGGSPWLVSFLVLTLGGLVKYLALLFGPLLLGAALRQQPTARARVRLVLIGGAACVALVVLAYAPFWVGAGTLRNFSDRGTLFTTSWLAVLQAPLSLRADAPSTGAPNLLSMLAPPQMVQSLTVSLGLGLLVAGVLWASWRSWEAPRDLARHALWLLLWFLFLCNTWFQPWYLLWAVALLAIQPWRAAATRVVTVFGCTAMLSYLIWVYLLAALGWYGDSAAWNALASALIYLPPMLTLVWGRRIPLARWAGLLRPAPHAAEKL